MTNGSHAGSYRKLGLRKALSRDQAQLAPLAGSDKNQSINGTSTQANQHLRAWTKSTWHKLISSAASFLTNAHVRIFSTRRIALGLLEFTLGFHIENLTWENSQGIKISKGISSYLLNAAFQCLWKLKLQFKVNDSKLILNRLRRTYFLKKIKLIA